MTNTKKNERAKLVSDMAAYMLKHEDNCTRDTLMLQFSQSEIDTYANAARAEANALSRRAA